MADLTVLKDEGLCELDRLPVSIRVLLESVLRNVDDDSITAEDVRNAASWEPDVPDVELPFTPSRVSVRRSTGRGRTRARRSRVTSSSTTAVPGHGTGGDTRSRSVRRERRHPSSRTPSIAHRGVARLPRDKSCQRTPHQDLGIVIPVRNGRLTRPRESIAWQ